MNTIGRYQDDERGQYNFNFSDNDGKHISVSFRAEPDWDLNVVFQEFRNFLIASGHDVEGEVGEIHAYDEDEYDNPMEQSWEDDSDEDGPMERTQFEPKDRLMQNQTQDKFSMDHFPNNGWPFGGLTTTALPGLTSVDLSALSSQSFNQFPTMAPLTSQQVQAWSLSSEQIRAFTTADLSDIAKWRVDAPGTIGGAKVTF